MNVSLKFSLLFMLIFLVAQGSHLKGAKISKFLNPPISSAQGTCYGAIFDAGSSSTKLRVYSWKCRDIIELPVLNPISILYAKVSPGISAFNQNLQGIKGYLSPLITKVQTAIPSNQWQSSPIMLGATAGMRLLSVADQSAIMIKVNKILSASGFLFEGEQWARIISGQEEGVFLWISANYLLGSIQNQTSSSASDYSKTAAVIDLGGASTQIAFNLPRYSQGNEYSLNLPENIDFNLYSASYLGYGNDQARKAYLLSTTFYEQVVQLSSTPGSNTVYSGCFNAGYNYTDTVSNQTVIGTSNPQQCIQQIIEYLNSSSCQDYEISNCSINGKFQPKVPRSGSIIAVSGINTAVKSFNINSPFYPIQLLNASIDFCSLDYSTVQQNEPSNSYISTKCFLGLYSATLLEKGFNLETYQIQSPDKIQSAEPQWSMGYLLDIISQLNCDGQTSTSSACTSLTSLYRKLLQPIK